MHNSWVVLTSLLIKLLSTILNHNILLFIKFLHQSDRNSNKQNLLIFGLINLFIHNIYLYYLLEILNATTISSTTANISNWCKYGHAFSKKVDGWKSAVWKLNYFYETITCRSRFFRIDELFASENRLKRPSIL